MELNEVIQNIFVKNRKCIINTDLDGILSGMLLKHFLGWNVVGYSCCCGKPEDDLWVDEKIKNLEDCVFVDLPVCVDNLTVIDQHFVAFDDKNIKQFNLNRNKVNPNIMRSRVFRNSSNRNEYTAKYPFGTAHFVLAVLENLNYISPEYKINFRKKIDNFDLADLILRADRVIGNTYAYTPNCLDWANWIMSIGRKNTQELFTIVKDEYKARKLREEQVEAKLLSFGCGGIDGDCSNMFQNKDYTLISKFLEFLGECLDLEPLPVFRFVNYNKLWGKRFFLNSYNFDIVRNESMKDNVFSYAFVTMKALSLTYIKKD